MYTILLPITWGFDGSNDDNICEEAYFSDLVKSFTTSWWIFNIMTQHSVIILTSCSNINTIEKIATGETP